MESGADRSDEVDQNQLLAILSRYNPSTTDYSINRLEKNVGKLSKIYHVTASTERSEKQNYVAKLLPDSEFARALIIRHGFARREVFVYKQILSRVEKLFQEELIAPRLIHAESISSTDDSYALILEDLTAQGFNLGNWSHGLNDGRLKAAIETLAKFHVGTRKLIEESGVEAWESALGPEDKNRDDIAADLDMFLHLGVNAATTCGNERLAKRLQNAVPDIREYVKSYTHSPEHGSFPTIIRHRDCTALNILFKPVVAQSGEDEWTARLLDYQNCSIGTGLHDIILLLYTSCNASFRREQTTTLVSDYVRAFNAHAERCGINSRIELGSTFHKESLEAKKLATYHAILGAKVWFVEGEAMPRLLGILEDAEKDGFI